MNNDSTAVNAAVGKPPVTTTAAIAGSRPRSGRGHDLAAKVLPPFLVGVLFFGGWEAFIDWQHVRPFILPKPSEIWRQFYDNFGLVRSASVVTGTNALIGLILGTVLGALLAAAANRYRVFGESSTRWRSPSPRSPRSSSSRC